MTLRASQLTHPSFTLAAQDVSKIHVTGIIKVIADFLFKHNLLILQLKRAQLFLCIFFTSQCGSPQKNQNSYGYTKHRSNRDKDTSHSVHSNISHAADETAFRTSGDTEYPKLAAIVAIIKAIALTNFFDLKFDFFIILFQ
ncbi:hypothetical protein [Vibrio phage 2E1]|nr:hypothetical protein [Vibrio phage 2E1]